MTMGAPNTAVTELMLTSVGAKAVRGDQIAEQAERAAAEEGRRDDQMSGSAVPNRDFMRCGTAMPTKEMGPANAVTQADRTLESKISAVRNARRWTPMFCAYTSPSW